MGMQTGSHATFVIPCLNEALTLRELLHECKTVFEKDPETRWEILLADNGSTDASLRIAQDEGISVVNVPRRGYGSALHAGILAAKSEFVCTPTRTEPICRRTP